MTGAAEIEEDWVEIRRFTDRIGAEMIRDFLADHDVRVAIHGNPQATRMTWSQTSDVIRIVVARADLETAKEALEAMTAGEHHPFRGPLPAREEIEDEDEAEEAPRFEKPRSVLTAVGLAVMLPVGSGHFYARHGAAGRVLCLGMLASFLYATVGHDASAFRPWGLLVVIDAVFAPFAVRRFNEKRISADRAQVFWAFCAVLLAFGFWRLTR